MASLIRRWRLAVTLVLCAWGCGAQTSPPADDVAAAADAAPDTALPEAIACSHPLSELVKVPLTLSLAAATAAAQKYCGTFPKSAGAVPCPGGGTVLYGATGFVGETWWFGASGQLVGYQWDTDNGFVTGCNENRWGTPGACPENPREEPADVSICPTPADATDASDVGPDTVDSGSETTPDVASAVDVPVENTLCSSQADCAADKWCSYTGCGFTTGQCLAKPSDCSGQFSPICGCDGHTYDSACHAQKAGKSIAAYSAPCLGSGCAPACATGYTCVDCASAGVQCLTPGQQCVGGK